MFRYFPPGTPIDNIPKPDEWFLTLDHIDGQPRIERRPQDSEYDRRYPHTIQYMSFPSWYELI